jgi:hypothetical protein
MTILIVMSKSKLFFVFLGWSFFISFAHSQNVDHIAGDNSMGGHFVKRVEYNSIMSSDWHNLKSKGKIEKALFGNFNAPVEFFYLPSFEGGSGFRVVRDSLGASILEIRYISNHDEVIKMAIRKASDPRYRIDLPAEVLNSLPREVFNLIWDYNNHRLKRDSEELPQHYKVESLSFPISEQFAEKLYQKTVSFIGDFKANGIPPEISDGYSVIFRTVVDDEVWSLDVHMPQGNALQLADLCRQIITDAKANTFEESKYIVDFEETGRKNRDSATQGGTSDESKSHEPRQGETPEVTPYGSALPP